MNVVAMLIGLFLAAIGLVGLVAPADLGTIAQNATTPVGVYVVSIIRLAIGIVFIRGARTARLPFVLQAFGVLAIVAAIAGPLMGFSRDEALVNWWVGQGAQLIQITGVVAMALGGLIAFSAIP